VALLDSRCFASQINPVRFAETHVFEKPSFPEKHPSSLCLSAPRSPLSFFPNVKELRRLYAIHRALSRRIIGSRLLSVFRSSEDISAGALLKNILAQHDFNSEAGIAAFLAEILASLENDKRPGGNPVKVIDQIRKGKTVLALYDLIYSLEYLKPRYALRIGNKELYQLSSGERGTLLLVFYLLVDKDDIPLVIDQPEENLDNQTVYELLVPCMKEAKQRRQIFIVTHNPNLAVVCDAEQIISADLDKKANCRMNYISGAIENPEINRAIVDILEGTMPAFDNRDSKYLGTAR
jgi:hypothetical protein